MNQKLKKIWKISLPHQKKGDRTEHTLRVLKFAEQLARKEKADLGVVRFAAILHDIGKYKETKKKKHAVCGEEMSRPILKNFSFSEERKNNILHCVRRHSKHSGDKAKTLEAKIIQDADKLDRLSPVRMAIYFYVGALKGKKFSVIIKKVKKIVSDTKNFNTKSARELAKQKKKLCHEFIRNFEHDWVDIKR